MGGSKTTGALHAARRYERLGYKVVLIRPVVSIRSHEQQGVLVTKNGEKFPALECDAAFGVEILAKGADVVWIDEPFLFRDEASLFQVIEDIRQKSIVLISAIGCDCDQKPFGTTMPKLLSVADQINWCSADCDCCGEMNTGTRHVILVSYVPGQPCPGGEESYVAACPECWTYLQQFEPPERRAKFLRGRPAIEKHTCSPECLCPVEF